MAVAWIQLRMTLFRCSKMTMFMLGTRGKSALLIIAIAVFLSTAHCSAHTNAQNARGKSAKMLKLEACPNNMWTINSINEDKGHRNTLLELELPKSDKIGMKYEAILACDGLVINGTGHQVLRVKKDTKKVAKFRLHLPVPKDKEESLLYGKELNHSCTFEIRDVSKMIDMSKVASIITQCQFRVRTFMHRILPTCDYEKSKELIEEIEVFKEQGQVQIYLKHSSNDIFTVDHDCHQGNVLGHNKTLTMDTEMLPLSPTGSENSAMLIAFYPPCETYNHSMRDLYTHKRMDDCHLEIFSLCQAGVISISETKVDFEDDAMRCHSPKPAYVEALENMELRFRIESKPVVGLICLLIGNGCLYFSIMPFAFTKCIKWVIKKLRALEKKRAKSREQVDPKPSTSNNMFDDKSPSVDYDDVEMSLFDKFSNDDLRHFVPESTHSEEASFPTQLEVQVDIEVVSEQPRKEATVDETEIIPHSPSHSKRRKSLKKRQSSANHEHKKRRSLSHSKSSEKRSKKHQNNTDISPPTIPIPPPPPPVPTTPNIMHTPPTTLPLNTGASPNKPNPTCLMDELQAKLKTRGSQSVPNSPKTQSRKTSPSPVRPNLMQELETKLQARNR